MIAGEILRPDYYSDPHKAVIAVMDRDAREVWRRHVTPVPLLDASVHGRTCVRDAAGDGYFQVWLWAGVDGVRWEFEQAPGGQPIVIEQAGSYVAKYSVAGRLCWVKRVPSGIGSIWMSPAAECSVISGDPAAGTLFKLTREGSFLPLAIDWPDVPESDGERRISGAAHDIAGALWVAGAYWNEGQPDLGDWASGFPFCARFDSDGRALWHILGEHTGPVATMPRATLIPATDGDMFVEGRIFVAPDQAAADPYGAVLAKVAPDGTLRWRRPEIHDFHIAGPQGGLVVVQFGATRLSQIDAAGNLTRYPPLGFASQVGPLGFMQAPLACLVERDDYVLLSPFDWIDATWLDGRTVQPGSGWTLLRLTHDTTVVRVNEQVHAMTRIAPTQTATVTIETTLDHSTILYTLDGSPPDLDAAIYRGPISLDSSAIVRAVAYDGRFSQRAESRPATIDFVDEWALNLSTDGGGAFITFPRAQTQLEGALVSISPVPLAGWSFLRWEGDFAGMEQDVSLSMDRDKSAKAVFGANIEFVALGAGEVIVDPPQGPYEYGSVVQLEARPSDGSQFVLWSGAVSGREPRMSLCVTQAAPIISALFLPSGQDPCYLHTSHDGPGALTVIPAKPFYLRGDTVTLIATPDPYASFLQWVGDVEGVSNPLIVELHGDMRIKARFDWLPHIVIQEGQIYRHAFEIRGPADATFQIQKSTNLVDWEPIAGQWFPGYSYQPGYDPLPTFFRTMQLRP